MLTEREAREEINAIRSKTRHQVLLHQKVLLLTRLMSLGTSTSEGVPIASSYLSNRKSSRSKGSNVGRSKIKGKVGGVRKSWEATQTGELEEEKVVKKN